jgi:hypothetical protein
VPSGDFYSVQYHAVIEGQLLDVPYESSVGIWFHARSINHPGATCVNTLPPVNDPQLPTANQRAGSRATAV